MKRLSVVALAMVVCGPAWAFECKFPKAPEANFKMKPAGYVTNVSKALLVSEGSAGTGGVGRPYYATISGKRFDYLLNGKNTTVAIKDHVFAGSCR